MSGAVSGTSLMSDDVTSGRVLLGNALTPSPCATSAETVPIESADSVVVGRTPAAAKPASVSRRTLVPSPSSIKGYLASATHVVPLEPASG